MPALPPTGGHWADAWLSWRDRLLSSPRFHRWAAAFPLTRPIARRRASQLFDLVAGFVYSQVLSACVQLDLFEILARSPQSPESLARQLGLSDEAMARLLAAAAALQLVERRRGGRFGLGALGAPLVGNDAIKAMVHHHTALYADLADPVALLRGRAAAAPGALARYWPYAAAEADDAPAGPEQLPPADVAAYSALMSASQPLVADQILDAYPVGRHTCLLDVGGGEGTFLAAAAARAPGLHLHLFDLPAVAERARARFAALGLSHRAQATGGSFLRDALPPGADLISLVRVVHDHDDAAVMTLLLAARAALPAGGTLLLAEPMADAPGARAMGDAYFGFYLLAMGRGKPRSPAQLQDMLQRAGFTQTRTVPTRMPLQTGLIVARAG